MTFDWGQLGSIATVVGVLGTGLMRLWGAVKKKLNKAAQDREAQIFSLNGIMHLTNRIPIRDRTG